MSNAKDFLGKDLNVGDKVVFMQKNYRNFLFGYITKITDFTCLVSHEKTNVCSKQTRQNHDQLIKVES